MSKLFSTGLKSLDVAEITQIPEDWDKFWQVARINYDFIFNRNSKNMTWRYLTNPNKYHILTLRQKGDLMGYLVYRIQCDESEKHVVITDFLTIPGNEKLVIAGINYIKEQAFKTGSNRISVWCDQNNPYYRLLKKTRFITRSDIPVICYQNSFANKIKTCSRWHFTIGDSDNI